MIPIVKPYLPSLSKYQAYLEGIYQRNWLTNSGPLLKELESRLSDYLGVKHLMLVANGTLALQVAYRALGVDTGDVITTPFTFAATPGSLMWQGLQPKFVDIADKSLNISPDLITKRLSTIKDSHNIRAIAAVHVFGNPCDVEQIDKIAQQHKLKVIYDAAHAFGCQYKGQSLLNYGDAATLSLHATKLFHCIEGGAIVFKHKDDIDKARQLINFGFDKDNMPEYAGINAKMSEFHAAMGLAMIDEIDDIVLQRKEMVATYEHHLSGAVEFQTWSEHSENNGAYMPVLFRSETELLKVRQALTHHAIQSRRYFYPSLNNAAVYKDVVSCPVSESTALRVLCLPIFMGLKKSEVTMICQTIKQCLVA
jgi:dTDP-4-amino-4,6-dideoxygalactose transaminase